MHYLLSSDPPLVAQKRYQTDISKWSILHRSVFEPGIGAEKGLPSTPFIHIKILKGSNRTTASPELLSPKTLPVMCGSTFTVLSVGDNDVLNLNKRTLPSKHHRLGLGQNDR
ncbi:10005_t:CDS:2 [Funneliformis geosporum]|uniref:10005_t:CDS:1 n=1 Tax=Funneliformis geosporum TaxID=1117311 RepID=A0A9W4T1I9_9GLOM|nr:10005_t:CDS:2 [Funneliformis geosporum]